MAKLFVLSFLFDPKLKLLSIKRTFPCFALATSLTTITQSVAQFRNTKLPGDILSPKLTNHQHPSFSNPCNLYYRQKAVNKMVYHIDSETYRIKKAGKH